MRKRKLSRKYIVFMQLVCCIVFFFSIIGVLALYQHRLNERFDTVLIDSLEENTEAQKSRAELVVSDLQSVLCTLQDILGFAESVVPPEQWGLVIQDGRVHIDYLDAEQVLEMYSTPGLSGSEKALCEQLLSGTDSITDFNDPWFADGDSLFALLHPVFFAGKLEGVLRAQIEASLLTEENIGSSFFNEVYIILSKPDGSVIYADTPYPNGENLFSATLQNGIGTDEVKKIQQVFEGNRASTISFSGKGNQYYISWETLDFNDWRIVRFARSPDVVLQTTTFVRSMILTGIGLIILTGAFCAVLIRLMLRKKYQLEAQQRRYNALAQFSDTLLFEYDVEKNRAIFTPNALERLDLDSRCLEGLSSEDYMMHLIHPDDRESVQKIFLSSELVLGETYYLEVRFRCKGGKYDWFGCQFKSIENEGRHTKRVVGKLMDIGDQRNREQLLRQAALTDALTGVYNRAAESIIDSLLKKDARGLFFMIDLDDFKNINDTYGHAAGDALLVGVAQSLKAVFRQEDIISRVGGDEFAVFFPGTSDLRVAENKAANIQSRLEQLDTAEIGQSVSVSIGVASAPQDGSVYAELAHAADEAMYDIKKQTKKGFALHNHRE